MPDNRPPIDPIIQLERVRKAKQAQAGAAGPDTALPDTEDEVALEFSRRHGEVLRYVNPWHRWLQWDAGRWRRVDDLRVFHSVRLIAREYAKFHDDKKLGKDAATAAIERAARNDRRHDTRVDVWDADLEIFNTPGRKR